MLTTRLEYNLSNTILLLQVCNFTNLTYNTYYK